MWIATMRIWARLGAGWYGGVTGPIPVPQCDYMMKRNGRYIHINSSCQYDTLDWHGGSRWCILDRTAPCRTLCRGCEMTDQKLIRNCVGKGSDDYPYSGCDWCGERPKRLYIYGAPANLPYNSRMFCNLKCYQAFCGKRWMDRARS